MTLEEQIMRDWEAASAWAREALTRTDWAPINVQTTDLTGMACEIGVIDEGGSILFESLINPQRPVEASARRLHKITDDMLAVAPTLPQVWDAMSVALEGRTTLLAYNAEYTAARLKQSALRYRLPVPAFDWQCIMQRYAQYCGNWNEHHGSYTFVKLPGARHRSIADARAALTCLHEMAKGLVPLPEWQ